MAASAAIPQIPVAAAVPPVSPLLAAGEAATNLIPFPPQDQRAPPEPPETTHTFHTRDAGPPGTPITAPSPTPTPEPTPSPTATPAAPANYDFTESEKKPEPAANYDFEGEKGAAPANFDFGEEEKKPEGSILQAQIDPSQDVLQKILAPPLQQDNDKLSDLIQKNAESVNELDNKHAAGEISDEDYQHQYAVENQNMLDQAKALQVDVRNHPVAYGTGEVLGDVGRAAKSYASTILPANTWETLGDAYNLGAAGDQADIFKKAGKLASDFPLALVPKGISDIGQNLEAFFKAQNESAQNAVNDLYQFRRGNIDEEELKRRQEINGEAEIPAQAKDEKMGTDWWNTFQDNMGRDEFLNRHGVQFQEPGNPDPTLEKQAAARSVAAGIEQGGVNFVNNLWWLRSILAPAVAGQKGVLSPGTQTVLRDQGVYAPSGKPFLAMSTEALKSELLTQSAKAQADLKRAQGEPQNIGKFFVPHGTLSGPELEKAGAPINQQAIAGGSFLTDPINPVLMMMPGVGEALGVNSILEPFVQKSLSLGGRIAAKTTELGEKTAAGLDVAGAKVGKFAQKHSAKVTGEVGGAVGAAFHLPGYVGGRVAGRLLGWTLQKPVQWTTEWGLRTLGDVPRTIAALTKPVAEGLLTAADDIKNGTSLLSQKTFFPQVFGRLGEQAAIGTGQMLPFAATSQTPEQVGSALALGPVLHLTLGGSAIAGKAAQDWFDSGFTRNPSLYSTPTRATYVPYGTNPLYDARTEEAMKTMSPQELNEFLEARKFTLGAMEIHYFKDTHYVEMLHEAEKEGKTVDPDLNSRGVAIRSDDPNAQPRVFVKQNYWDQASTHEIAHPFFDHILSPKAKQAWVDQAFETNDPNEFTLNYTKGGAKYDDLPESHASVKAGLDTYADGAPGMTKESIRDEMGAEALSGIFKGQRYDQLTKDPTLARRLKFSIGEILEHFGIDPLSPAAQSILGFKPSFITGTILDKLIRMPRKPLLPAEGPKAAPGAKPEPDLFSGQPKPSATSPSAEAKPATGGPSPTAGGPAPETGAEPKPQKPGPNVNPADVVKGLKGAGFSTADAKKAAQTTPGETWEEVVRNAVDAARAKREAESAAKRPPKSTPAEIAKQALMSEKGFTPEEAEKHVPNDTTDAVSAIRNAVKARDAEKATPEAKEQPERTTTTVAPQAKTPEPPEVKTPATPGSGLETIGQAGGAISENMRDMLWDKFQKGSTTEAGAPSNLLILAAKEKSAGRITSRAEFEDFITRYGQSLSSKPKAATPGSGPTIPPVVVPSQAPTGAPVPPASTGPQPPASPATTAPVVQAQPVLVTPQIPSAPVPPAAPQAAAPEPAPQAEKKAPEKATETPAKPAETTEGSAPVQKHLREQGKSAGEAQHEVHHALRGETPRPSLGRRGRANIGAYGYPGDASWDHNSLRGVGAFGHVSRPGSLIPHYSAGLTKEGAARRGLTHHGQEFIAEDGKTYRWDDTAPSDFEFQGKHHHVPDDYVDVYDPGHAPDRGVSAAQIASNEAYMARFGITSAGGSAGVRGPMIAGEEPRGPLSEPEEGQQPAQTPAAKTAETPTAAPPAVPEPEAKPEPVTEQTIADMEDRIRSEVQQGEKQSDEAYTAAIQKQVMREVGEQHAASLAPGDQRVKYDALSGMIFGKYFDPSDAYHQWLLRGVDGHDKAVVQQIEGAIKTGKDLWIDYGSAPHKEPGLATGAQRETAQTKSTAGARAKGEAEIQTAGKNILPSYVGVSQGEAGKPNSLFYSGTSPDKISSNAAQLSLRLAGTSPYKSGPAGDPVAEEDMRGYLHNINNGWKGDGSAKLKPTEVSKLPVESPGFVPYKMSKAKADFWNLAVSGRGAGLSAREMVKPDTASGKARLLALGNEGYVSGETEAPKEVTRAVAAGREREIEQAQERRDAELESQAHKFDVLRSIQKHGGLPSPQRNKALATSAGGMSYPKGEIADFYDAWRSLDKDSKAYLKKHYGVTAENLFTKDAPHPDKLNSRVSQTSEVSYDNAGELINAAQDALSELKNRQLSEVKSSGVRPGLTNPLHAMIEAQTPGWTKDTLHSGYEMLRADLTDDILPSGESAAEQIHPGHEAVARALQKGGYPPKEPIKAGFMPSEGFTSPNFEEGKKFEEVGPAFTGENHRQAKEFYGKVDRTVAKMAGMRKTPEQHDAFGDFPTGIENSVVTDYGDTPYMLAKAAESAKALHQGQLASLVWESHPHGPHLMHTIDTQLSPNDARAAMTKHGIENRTILADTPNDEPTRIKLFDSGDISPNVRALLDDPDSKIAAAKSERGRGEFIGDPEWSSRDRAREEYRRVYEDVQASRPDQDWKDFGDHWNEAEGHYDKIKSGAGKVAWMPSEEEADKPAIRLDGKRILTNGDGHSDILENMPSRIKFKKYEEGFVTKSGKFLTKQEAWDNASQLPNRPRMQGLNTEDLPFVSYDQIPSAAFMPGDVVEKGGERSQEDKAIIESAKRLNGTTNDVSKAGFILPDGSLLSNDKLGTKGGWHHRSVQYEGGPEISGTFEDAYPRLQRFLKAGAVRIDADPYHQSVVEGHLPLSPSQVSRIRDLIKRSQGGIGLDIINPKEGGTSFHEFYDEDSPRVKAIGEFSRFISKENQISPKTTGPSQAQFMPGDVVEGPGGERERIKSPAVKLGGKVFEGVNHEDAYSKARNDGSPEVIEDYNYHQPSQEGFSTTSGRFIGRHAAWTLAKENNQLKASAVAADRPFNALMTEEIQAGVRRPKTSGPLPGTGPEESQSKPGAAFMPSERMVEHPENPQVHTKEFKTWFKGSRVTDTEGNPLRLYHGTTRDFDAHNPEGMASSGNDWGKGVYMSNNPEDAGENYASLNSGELNSRMMRRYKTLLDQTDYQGGHAELVEMAKKAKVNIDPEEDADAIAYAIAEKELSDSHPSIQPLYASLKNPVEMGGTNPTRWNASDLRDYREAVSDVFDRLGSYDAHDAISHSLRTIRANDHPRAEDVINRLRNGEPVEKLSEETRGFDEYSPGGIAAEVLKTMGHDGVIDHDVFEKWGGDEYQKGMPGLTYGTTHVIAFDPKDVKSATGNRGTFSGRSANVNFMPGDLEKNASARILKPDEERHPLGTALPASGLGKTTPIYRGAETAGTDQARMAGYAEASRGQAGDKGRAIEEPAAARNQRINDEESRLVDHARQQGGLRDTSPNARFMPGEDRVSTGANGNPVRETSDYTKEALPGETMRYREPQAARIQLAPSEERSTPESGDEPIADAEKLPVNGHGPMDSNVGRVAYLPADKMPKDERSSIIDTPERVAKLAHAQMLAKHWIAENRPPKLSAEYSKSQLPSEKLKWKVEDLGDWIEGKNKYQDLKDPKVRDAMAKAATYDVMKRLSEDGSGLDWYDAIPDAAVKYVAEHLDPSIAENPENRAAYRMALAVTSNGQNVYANAETAYHAYQYWKEHGELPTDKKDFVGGGVKIQTMIKTFKKMNALRTKLGNEALADMVDKPETVEETNALRNKLGTQSLEDLLNKPMTVREMRAFGLDISGEAAGHTTHAALAMGPKIGSFYSALGKHFEHLVMDMWWKRTMNRMEGNMFGFSPTAFTSQLGELSRSIKSGEVDLPVEQRNAILGEIEHVQSHPDLTRGEAIRSTPELQKYVEATHREYQRPITDPDGRVRSYPEEKRTPSNLLAKNIDENLHLTNDAPTQPERPLYREIADKIQKNLKKAGIDMHIADIQSCLWYAEQDFYKKAGAANKGSDTSDYLDGAFSLVRHINDPKEAPSVPKVPKKKSRKLPALAGSY